jgi:26S proteasome regulatory subunit N12
VAECCEVAYARLGVAAAKKSMLLDSDAALRAYAQKKEWLVTDGFVHFGKALEVKHAQASDVPSLRLMAESLSYATELERIV